MHDDTTTTTITDTTAERDHRLLYATDRITMPLAMAAIYGQHNGLLTFEDLPLEMPDGAAFLVAVHKVLEERGVLAAYRREQAMNAEAAVCPWWCHGKHPAVFEDGDILIHEAHVATLVLTPTVGSAGEARVTISAAQLAQGYEGPSVDLTLDSTGDVNALRAESARDLSAALLAAADRLEEIERLTPA
ncbi:MAG: hypothetical protein ABI807_05505 [Sporichthyaceae bacterium]